MNEEKTFYIHFVNCIAVRGVKRGIIYDLQRNIYKLIPNDIVDIIQKSKDYSIEEIYKIYNDDSTLNDYFKFLLDNEFGFITNIKNELNLFPKLNYEWDYPGIFRSLVLDINENSKYINRTNIQKIDSTGIKFVQIIFSTFIDIQFIDKILSYFNGSRIAHIELVLDANYFISSNKMFKLFKKHLRLFRIIVINSNKNQIIKKKKRKFVIFKVKTNDFLEKPNLFYFTTNIKFFMESFFYNSFYNRKLFISSNGNFKNRLDSKVIYGNINNFDIKKLTEIKDFTKIWAIKKDNIEICKECEYRYICLDSRIPIFDEKSQMYKHKTKCNYDTYKAEWNYN